MDTSESNVFFVDDDQAVRDVVARILRGAGIKVFCFADPARCLAKIYSQKCDLLITDLRMPGMDGIELLEIVKRFSPWMPVLVMSGYGDIPTAVEAIKAGATDFIEKPLNKRSFLTKVKSMLGESPGTNPNKSFALLQTGIFGLVMEDKISNRITEGLCCFPRALRGIAAI